MAIALTHLTTGVDAGPDPSTASITPTAGADIFLWLGASDDLTHPSWRIPDQIDSITGGGATWTKIFYFPWRYRRAGWLYHGSGWSGSDTIDVDFDPTGADGGEPAQWVWIVDEVTGLDGTTPYSGLDTDALETGTAKNVTVTVTDTPGTGDFTYSVVHLENNITSLAASGFTALGETAAGTHGVRRAETGYSSSGATAAAWTWDNSQQGYCAGIITLNVAAAAGGRSKTMVLR